MLNNINSILSLSFKDREGNKLDTNDILMQYINDDNVFVSFTKLDKLGINPNSKYDTPLGIYAYPTKDAYEFYRLHNNPNKDDNDFISMIPFASNQPYFTLFKYKDKFKIIDKNYDIKQLEKDYNKLKKLYPNSKILNNSFNEILNIYKNDNSVPYKDKDKDMAIIFYITYHISNKNPIKWNKIFRELGYEAFVDPGYGIIHNAEKCQALFFSIKNIEIIDRFKNTKKSNIKAIYNKSIEDKNNLTIYNEFINCNINVSDSYVINKNFKNCNITSKKYLFNINDSIIDNSKIYNCEINGSVIKDTIVNKNIIFSCVLNNNNIEHSYIKGTTELDKCNLKNCKIEVHNKKSLEDNIFNNCLFNDCNNIVIYFCEFNKTNFNNCNLYFNSSVLNNCEINNSTIMLNSILTTKFNNVKINNIDLSTLNEKNIENIEIPIISKFEGETINIKDGLKNKELKSPIDLCFGSFLRENYPNLLFLCE